MTMRSFALTTIVLKLFLGHLIKLLPRPRSYGWSTWFMWIETTSPPQPVPLTIGCMPVHFAGPTNPTTEPIRAPSIQTVEARPIPTTLRWPAMQFSMKEQNIAVLVALKDLADVRENS